MGIGLNTGPVMVGNVGARQRVEYTAIGDTTNTASRLEGMTKGQAHMLFVSQSTREQLTAPPNDLAFVGEFEVRGRTAKLSIFSIPDSPESPASPEPPEPTNAPQAAGPDEEAAADLAE